MTRRTPCRNRCCASDLTPEFDTLVVNGLAEVGCLIVDTDLIFADCVQNFVGINNAVPTVALDIVGSALISDNLVVTDNLTVDTNTLFVNSVTNRVGVGTITPSVSLDVVGSLLVSDNATITDNLTVDTQTLFVNATNNRIGINTLVPDGRLHIALDETNNSGFVIGGSLTTAGNNYPVVDVNASVASTATTYYFSQLLSNLTISTLTPTRYSQLFSSPTILNGGTFTTLTNFDNLYAKIVTLADTGSTITNAQGLYIDNATISAGAITNLHGIYIASITGGSNNYALFTNAGIVRLGGDTYWSGAGSGLPYGEIYQQGNAIATSTAVQNTWYQIVNFSAGLGNLTTPSAASDNITILQAGVYNIICCLTIDGTALKTYEISVCLNGTPQTNIYAKYYAIDALAKEVTVGGLLTCAVNDVIDVRIRNTDALIGNPTIENANLFLSMLGG